MSLPPASPWHSLQSEHTRGLPLFTISFLTPLPALKSPSNSSDGGWLPCFSNLWITSLCSHLDHLHLPPPNSEFCSSKVSLKRAERQVSEYICCTHHPQKTSPHPIWKTPKNQWEERKAHRKIGNMLEQALHKRGIQMIKPRKRKARPHLAIRKIQSSCALSIAGINILPTQPCTPHPCTS